MILNKIGADGQVYGGVVMGIGQALSEGTQLDADGRHRNAHLTDYKLVTASDAPKIDIAWIETMFADAAPAFTAACHQASRGNPLYLRALLTELAAAGPADLEKTDLEEDLL